MIHEGSTAETIPSYLNFQLDKMGARTNGKTDNVCIYIDDLTVTEDKVGEIAFDFVSGDEPAPVYEKRPLVLTTLMCGAQAAAEERRSTVTLIWDLAAAFRQT